MKTFVMALIKSIFGDAANTMAVLAALAVAFALATVGASSWTGWGLVIVLLPSVFALAGRYGRPK